MSKLAVTVPFHAGEESFPSFCSRVAVANGAASSRSFAMHMGIRFRAIALGEPAVLDLIAEVTGVDARLLATGLATKEENEFLINGEVVTSPYFNRTRFRYCPTCIAEDVATGTGPLASRPYGRLAWQVSFVRSCHLHQTALAVSPRDVRFDVRDDFSAIWRSLPDEEKTISCSALPSSRFERYVLRRLAGLEVSEGWIDDMPIYVVGHLSETIGAAALFGKWFTSIRLKDADWHAAADAGFDILKSKNRFRAFLTARQEEFLRKRRNDYSGQALYGTLFRRLGEQKKEDRNYDPVREFIREHANRTLPFGPDDDLFGRLGLPRRLHSIKTAADESGLSIKLLRSYLLHEGIVTKGDLALTPHRVFIDARVVDEMLAKRAPEEADGIKKATVEEKEACSILGVGRGVWKHIASTFGLRNKDYARVSRRKLEAFLSELHSAAKPDLPIRADLMKPLSAALACKCHVAQVLKLVLSHQLETIVFDASREGISKILVDRAEVQNALLGANERQHLTSFEVADRLQIDINSLIKLATSGVLPRTRRSGGLKQFFYSLKDVEHFNVTYASTSRIAAAAGCSTATVAGTLREVGVSPALGAAVRSAHFYLIADLAGVYPQPTIDRLLKLHEGASVPHA